MKKQLESIEQTIEEFEVLRAKIEEENKLKRKRKARNLISKMKSDDKTESDLQDKSVVKLKPFQPYSCCEEIWCTCYDNQDENEVAQENESYYSEKHAEDIILYYGNN